MRRETDRLTALTASLYNHGISATTTRGGAVRLSPHVSTGAQLLAILRAAFTGLAGVI